MIVFILFEKGFLCPICHHKCNDHTDLEQHYSQVHLQRTELDNKDTKHVTQQEEKQVENE